MILISYILIFFYNINSLRGDFLRDGIGSLRILPGNNDNNGNRAIEAKDVSCGFNVIQSNQAFRISTPLVKYGIPYPTGYSCSWRFHGSGCSPIISCDTFVLPSSVGCSDASLEVTDGFSRTEKFCGSNAPQNVTTGSRILEANFESGYSTLPTRGLSCVVSCLQSLNETTEHLVSTLIQPNTTNCACGVPGAPPPEELHRVVGGRAAVPLFWKWQVALAPKTRKTPFCGASLINDRFVLSAAHCVIMTGLVTFPAMGDVLLNDYDLVNATETITIRKSIVGITTHPLYSPTSQDYDYAIIEFAEGVNLTATEEPKVTPVCLPPRENHDLFVDRIGTVTGWGTTSEGGQTSKVIQQADIPVITNEKCDENYGNKSKITPRMICAGFPQGKIDACQGDSGGPFVLNENGTYYQIGVVSFGQGCARPEKAGVYSRVTEVGDWIRQMAKTGTWCSQ